MKSLSDKERYIPPQGLHIFLFDDVKEAVKRIKERLQEHRGVLNLGVVLVLIDEEVGEKLI
ncbi:hypothetical protein LCGC14_2914560 [marine sediment metagenome]|uniref:Uncharacterized protein n=1 Tax=marine sediment metagenome TaxID=412755 RepID=A0A0F9AGV1_9ZZZZ